MPLKLPSFFALNQRGSVLEQKGLVMKFAQIAVGAAALIVLAAQSAAAQPGPEQPASEQPAPEQPAPAQSGPAQPNAPPPAVATTNVNLRQGPGTTYTVITTIPAGAPVEVSGCQGQWCQVTFQGQNGYVIATSLGQGGAGPAPAGAPPPGAYGGGPPPGYYGPPGYPPPPLGYPPPPPPYYGPYPYGYGYYGPYGRGRYYRRW